MNKLIFIIEDEPDMLELLAYILERENFEVFKCKNGKEALSALETMQPDLILLDLMLPDMSGLEICKRIQDDSVQSMIPIIMLTSRNDEYDVLTSFNFGCSDYITKPFNEKILIARIKASLLKNNGCSDSEKNKIIKIDKMIIDFLRFEVSIKNKIINLTPLEFKLLYLLVKNKNKVFSRKQIFNEIYENDDYRGDRAIDILVNRIRKKIKNYSENLETIYGVGYSFKVN